MSTPSSLSRIIRLAHEPPEVDLGRIEEDILDRRRRLNAPPEPEPEDRLKAALTPIGNQAYWKPPHNLLVNFALMGVNLWKFTCLQTFWKQKGYRPNANEIILRLNWTSTGPDGVIGQKDPSGFAHMSDRQVDILLAEVQKAPTVEQTMLKELKLMEQQFGIEIPDSIQKGLASKSLAVAKRRWGANRLRMKNLVIPLDGSKPYEET